MTDHPFDFSAEKNRANFVKHGVALEDFAGFDQTPEVRRDDRFAYSEDRFRAFGRIETKGYMIAYMIRDGRVRLISFRRAHEKDRKSVV